MSVTDESKEQATVDSKPGVSPNKRRALSFLKFLVYLLLILFFGIRIIPSVKLKDYAPDQWFKKNFDIHGDLSEVEKNAINALYKKVNKVIDSIPYDYRNNTDDVLKELHPALRKYSRRSLLKLIGNITEEIKSDKSAVPRFKRDDYFLEYTPEVELVEWFVHDNSGTNEAKPRYSLKCSIRNLTDRYIQKIIVRIYSKEQHHVYKTNTSWLVYDQFYTLVPVIAFQPIDYQQFICSINHGTYSYINKNTLFCEIRTVYIN